jgi:dipeptidyl-peptidase-4
MKKDFPCRTFCTWGRYRIAKKEVNLLRLKVIKCIILVAGLMLIPSLIFAQEEKQLEREAMFHRYLEFASMVKGETLNPQWMSDGNSFCYAEGFPEQTIIYKVDPVANTKEPLLDTVRLRQALTPLLGHELPYKGLPFQDVKFVDEEKAVKFAVEGREFICQLDTYKITPAPGLSKEEKDRMIPKFVRKGIMAGAPDVMEILSPDSRWFLGAEDHNLYLRSTYDGRKESLTTDGIKDYEWDIEGAMWSPNSFKLAAIKVDNRKVPLLPIVHWLKPTEEVEWVHFTKAGGPMPQSELFILDIFSKRKTRVDTGKEEDQNIHIIGWNPEGSELLLVRINREQKKLDLMAADPETGSTRIIITETSRTFLRLRIPIFLEKGKKFLWMCEKSGWNHIYLYDVKGKLLMQVTEGAFPVLEIVAIDEDESWVYFTAHTEKRLYDTHLCRANLDGKEFKRLTEAIGRHNIQFSPSKKFYLDTHSSVKRPPVVELRKADGALLQTILKANIDALIELKWSPPEEIVVKAADGKTDLYGAIFKPHNFNPSKKYPVIDSIYGGPQDVVVPHTFSLSDSFLAVRAQALAQLGFIVYIVDARGTPERGKEFQDVVYGNFGRNEIPDHVAALKELASKRTYMDLTRVGIWGASWGGYMTVRAMVLAPDVFHVGIAFYPVVDLYDHMATAIEHYMGVPQNNREGYEYGSSLRLAHKLKGKLLLIHGTSDVNATFSSTMKMVEALIRAGRLFDLIIFPGETHRFTRSKLAYAFELTRRYFQEYLKP